MVRILVPSGALGLGYDKAALDRAVAAKPDLIAIDGGSTDSGPSYLGRGVSKYARAATKAEWRGLIEARAVAGVPLVIGTAGTCGADSAVDWLYDITVEILAELGQSAKIAVLKSGQPAARIKSALAAGDITPLPHAPAIDAGVIDDCTHIVALAGAEQIAAALDTGADIVIAGRTTDTAIIAALPILRGCHTGAAWHGAKVGECGALCATNPQSGVILVDFDDTAFVVTPMADGAHATPHTVSAHMLYENSDPFILFEPGGHLDVTGAKYTALDDTRVRVEGSVWVPSDRYTVKLEGARITGYQTVIMALLRDRRYVANAKAWCDDIAVKHAAKVTDRLGEIDYRLDLRIIGQDATLGALENRPADLTEAGVMAIVTAPDQATANDIAKLLNPYLLHHPLTQAEEQPTFAFPFSPAEIDRGAAYEFCLNHVLTLRDPMEAFTLEVRDV
ncbi:acyclic terpene utilization AtuA family protein [Octadecabacter sp. R77987]|uniref:acyclic terpene utilization AtuA family protein n=1 Tax=Octadecabacter sp. R77987 TaxID=3093874 RepID=UPI00366A9406